MSRSLPLIILRFDSLPSTNTEAARQAMQGAAEGLCVMAREQTAGRGRQGRDWLSPKDAGLYFSIVLRPRLALSCWSLLTLMAAIAVRDAVQEACALKADIKWPNDLLVNDLKLCGILAETIETESGRTAIVGIGINLSERALPPHLRETATSIEAAIGSTPDAETILRPLVRHLARRYAELHEADGPAAILRAWATASSYAEGRPVRVTLNDEVVAGTTRGLEPDGALRVETSAGEIKIVRAGDVTALRACLKSSVPRRRSIQ